MGEFTFPPARGSHLLENQRKAVSGTQVSLLSSEVSVARGMPARAVFNCGLSIRGLKFCSEQSPQCLSFPGAHIRPCPARDSPPLSGLRQTLGPKSQDIPVLWRVLPALGSAVRRLPAVLEIPVSGLAGGSLQLDSSFLPSPSSPGDPGFCLGVLGSVPSLCRHWGANLQSYAKLET